MPIYRSKSAKRSSNASGSSASAKSQEAAKSSSLPKDERKKPMDAGTVKRFLASNSQFLDAYVKASVDLSRLRDWLENKEKTAKLAGRTVQVPRCPNASLLHHFQRGQEYGRYLEPTCCTCTLLPVGQKSRRPYIIFAVDSCDAAGHFKHDFTVPRVMTEKEMGAFTRRYGLDLLRRMNMY